MTCTGSRCSSCSWDSPSSAGPTHGASQRNNEHTSRNWACPAGLGPGVSSGTVHGGPQAKSDGSGTTTSFRTQRVTVRPNVSMSHLSVQQVKVVHGLLQRPLASDLWLSTLRTGELVDGALLDGHGEGGGKAGLTQYAGTMSHADDLAEGHLVMTDWTGVGQEPKRRREIRVMLNRLYDIISAEAPPLQADQSQVDSRLVWRQAGHHLPEVCLVGWS